MAKYKFTIKIGTGTEQVFTADSYNVTIKGERKIELGLFFMRYSINELSFLGDAYKLLRETFLNTSCDDCEIRVYQTCETAETEIYKGKFNRYDISIDFSKCIAKIKNTVRDKYSCVIDTYNIKHNGVNVTPMRFPSTLRQFVYQEYCVESTIQYSSPCVGAWGYVGGNTLSCVTGNVPDPYAVYAKDIIYMPFVGGLPVEPSGSYTQDGTIFFNGIEYSKWVRPSSTPVTTMEVLYSALVPRGCENYSATPILNPCDGLLYAVQICKPIQNYSFSRSFRLFDIIEALCAKTGCLNGVISDLFLWRPVGDAPDFNGGATNYVYGGAHEYNYLLLIQKSDLKNWNSSDHATKSDITLKEVLTWLYNEFQCFWHVTDDGYLRIEHIKYYLTKNPDFVQTDDNDLKIIPTIPKQEVWQNMEQFNAEFVGYPIEYTCSTAQEVRYHSERLTNDVDVILLNNDDIEDDGWVIMAADNTGEVIVNPGLLTSLLISNEPMSRTRLHDRFWKHWRFNKDFTMNAAATNYIDFLKPLYSQDKVEIVNCCFDISNIENNKKTDLINMVDSDRVGFFDNIELSLRTGLMKARIKF